MVIASATPDVVRLPLGVVVGAAATLSMDVVMRRLPEGGTPPRVAAGVLTGTHPDDSPARLSRFVHYFAGVGTGVLYVWMTLAAEYLLGGAPSAFSTGLTAVFLYVSMVGFFGLVPLPASDIEDGRRRRVLLDWCLSAAVYVVVAIPVALASTVAVGTLLPG